MMNGFLREDRRQKKDERRQIKDERRQIKEFENLKMSIIANI